jgi:putative ABC transport system substrate-binding protein
MGGASASWRWSTTTPANAWVLVAGTSISGIRVPRELDKIIAERGRPAAIAYSITQRLWFPVAETRGARHPGRKCDRTKKMHLGEGRVRSPTRRADRHRRPLIDRRDLFALFGGAVALWPLASIAQERKVPTIGVLAVGSRGLESFWRLFREVMQERGYIEGQSIRYEFRSDQGQVSRLPELAAELVRLKVDLIVTWFTPAVQAAREATSEIPIVMTLAGNPVETGLVESLARPGGNITGMAGVAAELAGKSVELIREMLPSGHRGIALANAPDPFSKPFLEHIRLGGAATGTIIEPKMIHSLTELEAAFLAMETDRPDAVIVQPSLPTKRVAELAVRYRIPAVSVIRGFADDGGLMVYQSREVDLYRQSASYVEKILKGAKPADLPIQQPTKFELIINMKTAKAIGLTVPPAFLDRADEVIE